MNFPSLSSTVERFRIYTLVDSPEEEGEEIVAYGTACGVQYVIINTKVYYPVTTYIPSFAKTEKRPHSPTEDPEDHPKRMR